MGAVLLLASLEQQDVEIDIFVQFILPVILMFDLLPQVLPVNTHISCEENNPGTGNCAAEGTQA